jgi:hypothetical protein
MNAIKSMIRNFTIQFRMMGAIVMVVVLLLAVDQALTVNDHLSSLYSAYGDVRRFEKDLILSREDPAKVADYEKKWLTAVTSVRT